MLHAGFCLWVGTNSLHAKLLGTLSAVANEQRAMSVKPKKARAAQRTITFHAHFHAESMHAGALIARDRWICLLVIDGSNFLDPSITIHGSRANRSIDPD